jgi:type II secretory pathway component PulF
MAQYIYEIINNGKDQSGKIYADSIEEAALQIKKPGCFIVRLEEKKLTDSIFYSLKPNPKFSRYDKINFTDHLATSIGAGTPLQEALESYVEPGDKKSEIIDTINKDIQRGKKLSEAMAKHPEVFSSLYIALVQAGEISGSLSEILEYLANELRREYEFVQRVKSAMLYPFIVLSVSVVVVVIVLGVILPKIIEITKNFGGDLPTITKVVVKFSELLSIFALPLSLSAIVLIVLGIYIFRNPTVKQTINSKLIKLPLVGLIIRQFILARFLRIVGGCIRYGIQLPKAFELSGSVVDNILYKNACENINKKIIRGQKLSSAFADEDKLLFPSIISRTIRGGEKTGKVDVGLLRLSSYYETEVDRNLKRLTDLIEPAMIIALGILVALIAISVIAPIYQMTSLI